MLGRRIGSYRIEKKIGAGGVGEVFLAVDEALGRQVAVKALRPELAAQEQLVERFRSEAKTLARLNHPNIATLFAFLEEADGLFMVMEFVEGRTLSAVIRSAGRLQPGSALPLLDQALEGLGYAHELGVVHRDIKGSNLMVDARFRVKIMDFGIARVVGSAHMTRVGNLVGTPEYMAPEQIRGEDATARSDIYSLGILLYHMLAGRVPFRAKGDFETMRAQVEDEPPPLREFAPDVPAPIEDVVMRALAKDPEERFATTRAFRDAMEEALSATDLTGSWNQTRPLAAPELFGPEVDPDAPTEVPGSAKALEPTAPLTRALDGVISAVRRLRSSFGREQRSGWLFAGGMAVLFLVALGTNRIASRQFDTQDPVPAQTPVAVVDPYTWTADASEVTVEPLSPEDAERLGLAPPAPPKRVEAAARARRVPKVPPEQKPAPAPADKGSGWKVRRR